MEALIELYGDPRIKSGGVWGGIDERYMAVMHRWLTREDMRFFTGVVDASQKDPMWPPRRNFWLKLYDEGKIDAAWAALSSQAFDYARQHLMRQDAKNAYTRVGYQQARQNTSLLIMKIGNKIMVDGCHSYRRTCSALRIPWLRSCSRKVMIVNKSCAPLTEGLKVPPSHTAAFRPGAAGSGI